MTELPIRNEGDAKLYYYNLLKELTFNSKEKINQLSQIAETNSVYADTITDVVYKHLKETIPGQKLPMLYLIDSIIKNVGGIYKRLFEKYIVEIFLLVFESGTGDIKTSLFKLRNTWKNVINERELAKLDRLVKERDSHWPIQSMTENNCVYVNPTIFPKVEKEQEKPPPTKPLMTQSNSQPNLEPESHLANSKPEKQSKPIKNLLENLNSIPTPIKKMKILEELRKVKVEKKETNNVRENVAQPQPAPVQSTSNEMMDTDVINAFDTEKLKTIMKTVKPNTQPHNIPFRPQVHERPPAPLFRHKLPPRPQHIEVRPHPGPPPNFPHPEPHQHPRHIYARPPYHIREQHEQMRMPTQDPRLLPSRDNRPPRPLMDAGGYRPRHALTRPRPFEHPRPMRKPGNEHIRPPSSLSLPRSRLPLHSPGEPHEDMKYKVVEQDIPRLEMKMECLFDRINVIVQHIHRGEQCTSCGLRFDKNSSSYKIHLDWHYHVNRYKPKSTHWYLPDSDWISYVDNPKEVLSDVFEKEKREKWIQDKKEEEEIANVVLRDSELVQRCRICRDMLEMYFDQDNDEWCCKDAVRLGNKVVVHKECAKDYKGAPFDMTPTPLAERSLGKEGLFESPETPSRKIGPQEFTITSEHFNVLKDFLESTKESQKVPADSTQNFPVFNPDRIDLDDSDSEDTANMSIDTKDEITELEKQSELNGCSVLPDDKEICAVCGEHFSSFFSDNQDTWYWKDALRVEGVLSHRACLEGGSTVDMKSPSIESDRSMETNSTDLNQIEDREEKTDLNDSNSIIDINSVIQVYPTPLDLPVRQPGEPTSTEPSTEEQSEYNSRIESPK